MVFSPSLRVALILTGHLRDTCDRRGSGKGLATLAAHADMCRSAFARCDIFLHTWDRLEKPPPPTLNTTRRCSAKSSHKCRKNPRLFDTPHRSSWPCVQNVTALLDPVAVTVERQDRALGHASDERRWTMHETLQGFRMNSASMIGGAELVRRHAAAMGHQYAAAVRMRADVGATNIDLRSDFRPQFLSNRSWRSVRVHAMLAAANGHTNDHDDGSHGSAPRMLMNCQRPRMKRMDFCFWSAPAAPLLDVMGALRVELSGDESREQACRAYLNHNFTTSYMCQYGLGTMFHSLFSEHILFCAMHAARVASSSLVHEFGENDYYLTRQTWQPKGRDADSHADKCRPSWVLNATANGSATGATSVPCGPESFTALLACDCDDPAGCISRPSETESVAVGMATSFVPPGLPLDVEMRRPRYTKPPMQTFALRARCDSRAHPQTLLALFLTITTSPSRLARPRAVRAPRSVLLRQHTPRATIAHPASPPPSRPHPQAARPAASERRCHVRQQHAAGGVLERGICGELPLPRAPGTAVTCARARSPTLGWPPAGSRHAF